MNLYEIIKNNICFFGILFLVYSLIVRISKFAVCRISICKNRKIKNILVKIILFVITPDYSITKCMKKEYKKELSETNVDDNINKQKLGKMIKNFNTLNLILSIIFCIIAIISKNKCYNFAIILMLIRYISRTLEVVISFVLDIFDKQSEKKSNLRSKDRIYLALRSFLEIFILAVIFIYLINNNIFDSFVIAFESIYHEFEDVNNIKFIQLFLALTFYAVITNYISNIINSKEDEHKKYKLDLEVIKKNKID